MDENNYLKVHFAAFTYDELRDILLGEDVLMRGSTLPNDWYIYIKPERFEKLKLSLLIDSCLVQQAEDSNIVEVSRRNVNGNTE